MVSHSRPQTRQKMASKNMKVKRFLLRYYPPGIILEFKARPGDSQVPDLRTVNLLDLSPESDVDKTVAAVLQREQIPMKYSTHITDLVRRLVKALKDGENQEFKRYKATAVIESHILPLTNIAFNKNGDLFATGSYDRTCKLWSTKSGTEVTTLVGHENVVYCLCFNVPYGDKLLTGSFDKTARIWDVETKQCLFTLRGHTNEIVCVDFSPKSSRCATGSMDTTAKVWDVHTGMELATLASHDKEIVSLKWSHTGDAILTASFDTTSRIWMPSDKCDFQCVAVLKGHCGEVSTAKWTFDGSRVITGAIDETVRIWHVKEAMSTPEESILSPTYTLGGMEGWDEILDITVNATGSLAACAGSDGMARIFCTETGQVLQTLMGHEDEISRVVFNPKGDLLLTTSADNSTRIWHTKSGKCLQVLQGHSGEVFSCAFNYDSTIILTGSKDNTCRVWKQVGTSTGFKT